jgi:hypothetical protein
MIAWYDTFKINWRDALSEKYFSVKYILNFAVCFSLYMLIVQFLVWNRYRPGVILHDPIQQFFTPIDFSFWIFSITYFCAVSFILYIAARPRDFYYGGRAFTLIFVMRAVFIYTLPLLPPTDTIPLHDSFMDFLVGPKNDILNDLFYSGHIADLSFFVLCCKNKSLKYFYIFSAIVVAVMLVWQHVHYTADVIASPFFAYVFYAVLAKDKVDSSSK